MSRSVAVLALALCLVAPAGRAQNGGSGVHRLGGIEPPDPAALAADPAAFEDMLTEQGLALDLEAGTISARGGTLHDAASLRYPIEYLMVTDRGQTHESLFVVKAQPSVLDACFRALGLVPGHPMRWVMKDPPPLPEALEAGEDVPWEASPADGPLIEVEAVWTDDDGRHHRQSLESMLIDVRDGEPVEELDWVYTGSGVGPLRQGRSVVQTFMADLQGNIIATWLTGMGAALLELNSLEGVDDTLYTINPDTAPQRNTPVTIVFRDAKREAPIAPPPSGVTVVQGEDGRHLDEWLTRATPWGFDGVVHIARGDDVLLHKAYGLADHERGVPMSTRTVFPLGDMSRLFVRTAIGQLVGADQLDLSDAIARHLDDVPEDKSRITIQDLLDRTSRLPSTGVVDKWWADTDAAVAGILALPLERSVPDEYGRRGQLDDTLLIGIVESAASMSWGNYLAEKIFDPVNMIDSGVMGEPRWAGGQIPSESTKEWTAPSSVTSRVRWPIHGHGGLVSSVRDLHRWERGVRTGVLVPPEQAEFVLADRVAIEYVPDERLSMFPRQVRGGAGTRLQVRWALIDDLSYWIAESNVSDAAPWYPRAFSDLTSRLHTQMFEDDWSFPPLVTQLTPEWAAAVEGVYVRGDPIDTRLQLEMADGEMRIRFLEGAISVLGGSPQEFGARRDLRPVSRGTWIAWSRTAGGVTELSFRFDEDGKATGFSAHDLEWGETYEFRAEDPPER